MVHFNDQMAGSDHSSEATQLPEKPEGEVIVTKTYTKLPRRQWTLIAVTALLHVLLWSSSMSLGVTIFQLVSDPNDTTNLASQTLTLTSSIATLAYVLLHTIFSLKQRAWRHERRRPSIERTTYVAVRFAVTLCILWLLTTGWNMIIVARQPTCLPKSNGLDGWEAGPTCHANRIGVASSTIALISSFTLFYMLATVPRPFESHLFKYSNKLPSTPNNLTPGTSRRPSPSLSPTSALEKHRTHGSVSTHLRSPSILSSTTDIDTLDLNSTSPTSTIKAPSPIRPGLGIFTSNEQPPPLPPAFIMSARASSSNLETQSLAPSASTQHLPLPSHIHNSALPPGFVPIPLSAPLPPSSWRAMHPSSPSLPAASRSSPHIPNTNRGANVGYYKPHFSRSSISLTRPHRLSGVTPATSVAWSSRSGSTGPDSEAVASSSSGTGNSVSNHTGAVNHTTMLSENAYAFTLNGIPIEGAGSSPPPSTSIKGKEWVVVGHHRTVSAPDTTSGGQQRPIQQQQVSRDLEGKVRKSASRRSRIENNSTPAIDVSASSRSSEESQSQSRTPDLSHTIKRKPLDRTASMNGINITQSQDVPVPKLNVRKSRSQSTIGYTYQSTTRTLKSASRSSHHRLGRSTSSGSRDEHGPLTFEQVKNKPLPRIAAL
ncbi:unnamed protein product [Periconia digitata]|uniref:Uncharacterized protein n=1 Tax=Periconia digitata TaxID=1303443 RepID=A0A9W4XIH6_9PLEO|nr:unnamed protein product [Periconia digitata]